MNWRLAALLATSGLLAGCDGGLKIQGLLVTSQGLPVANSPVYLYIDGKPDRYDPVLWTNSDGVFELRRLDCPCDFDVQLVGVHATQGVGLLMTDHDRLEKDPQVILTLVVPPVSASPVPASPAAQASTPSPDPRPADE